MQVERDDWNPKSGGGGSSHNTTGIMRKLHLSDGNLAHNWDNSVDSNDNIESEIETNTL